MSKTPKIKKLKLSKLASHALDVDAVSSCTRVPFPCVTVRTGKVSISMQVVEFVDAEKPEQRFQISLPGNISFVKGDVQDVTDDDILEIRQAIQQAVFDVNARTWQLSLEDSALFAKKIKKAYSHIQ